MHLYEQITLGHKSNSDALLMLSQGVFMCMNSWCLEAQDKCKIGWMNSMQTKRRMDMTNTILNMKGNKKYHTYHHQGTFNSTVLTVIYSFIYFFFNTVDVYIYARNLLFCNFARGIPRKIKLLAFIFLLLKYMYASTLV